MHIERAMWLQNTVCSAELLCNNLLIFYVDILIPRNPGNDWRMRMQLIPGVEELEPGFEASHAPERKEHYRCM